MVFSSNAVQTQMQSPIGTLYLVASDEGLHNVTLAPDKQTRVFADHPILKKAIEQLTEYFEGQRQSFDLPLVAEGTQFQKLAWSELVKIPFGQTISYREQAHRLGDCKKARAVGSANSKNPLMVIIPCHRVIGADGGLGGYSGGVEVKELLLNLERSVLRPL